MQYLDWVLLYGFSLVTFYVILTWLFRDRG